MCLACCTPKPGPSLVFAGSQSPDIQEAGPLVMNPQQVEASERQEAGTVIGQGVCWGFLIKAPRQVLAVCFAVRAA